MSFSVFDIMREEGKNNDEFEKRAKEALEETFRRINDANVDSISKVGSSSEENGMGTKREECDLVSDYMEDVEANLRVFNGMGKYSKSESSLEGEDIGSKKREYDSVFNFVREEDDDDELEKRAKEALEETFRRINDANVDSISKVGSSSEGKNMGAKKEVYDSVFDFMEE